ELISFTINFYNPGSSTRKYCDWTSVGLRSDSIAYGQLGTGSFYGNTNVINGIRLLFSSGNIAAGCRVILRGIKKVV
ncbi:MAG: hypothetical protein ACXABY_26035, partial [Candidatus Thorarchaeota archaeon]